MITPQLLSVNKIKVIVERANTGEWLHGKWVNAERTLITVDANIQPALMGNQAKRLPEGDRTKRSIVIYSIQELLMTREGDTARLGDIVHYDGEKWEVRSAITYKMNILNHCESIAVLLDEV